MIEFRAISKHFTQNGHAIKALEDLSFTIEKGEFVAVLGPSGCGKSTLVAIAAGLMVPSAGEVLLGGHTIIGTNPSVTVIFQEIALFPWKTALKNIEFALKNAGNADRKTRREKALELLKFVGLVGFEDCYPYQLSGGMKQRVGMARALAFDSECILMDEPFSALDTSLRDELHVQVQKLFQHVNKTILLVTHDLNEAIILADRVIVLTRRPGRVKTVLKVDLPRPRTTDLYTTPEFARIQQILRNAVMEP